MTESQLKPRPAPPAIPWWRQICVHEWVLTAYLGVLGLFGLGAPTDEGRTHALSLVGPMLGGWLLLITLVRGGHWRHPWLMPITYRIVAFGMVMGSYLTFSEYLPAINRYVLDEQLYALDLQLFGVEPAVYFDRYVNAFTTEWFAFFYYGYFWVVGGFVFPILFSPRGRNIHQFALGIVLTFCIGHCGYLLVPGYGPYHAMPEVFVNELPPGFWMDAVWGVVRSAGAQMDIFPSLHTGGPAFIVLFAYSNRKHAPFRYIWLPLAFFVANIILATMFLRWHYVIDVVVGLLLALTAHLLTLRIWPHEQEQSAADGSSPVWPPLPFGSRTSK